MLTNHPTKVFLSGISDQRSLEYLSRLLGEEEVTKTTVTAQRSREATVGESGQQMRLVPIDVIRQVAPGEGVLVHRTLRPAHLQHPAVLQGSAALGIGRSAVPGLTDLGSLGTARVWAARSAHPGETV